MTPEERKKWIPYVKETAAEFGISARSAWEIFCALGPNEAYDGFITMLEDYADEMGE